MVSLVNIHPKNQIISLILIFSGISGIFFSFQGCEPKFEIYAPDQQIGVVFGILNPEDSVQFVRVSGAFQERGDAQAYAASHDLSWRGMSVVMEGSDGSIHRGVETEMSRDTTGDFYPGQAVYKFRTDGSGPGAEAITGGTVYSLRISDPGDSLVLEAATRVPGTPDILDNLKIQRGQGALRCRPVLDLRQPLDMKWLPAGGYAFEIRVKLYYKITGVPDTIIWGPSELILENNGCNDGWDRLCYKFNGRELQNYLLGRMPAGPVVYTYDIQDSCVINPHDNPVINDQLPKAFEFEITALDSALARYMIATNSNVLDLTAAKPQFTNITGTIPALGIFGSVNFDREYAILGLCSEWILGLNDRFRPAGCEEL